MPEDIAMGLWGQSYYCTSKLHSHSLVFNDTEANLPWHASLGEGDTDPTYRDWVLS